MAELPRDAREVLEFWLGPLDEDGLADSPHQRQWWVKDPDFDATVCVRFDDLHRRLRSRLPSGWTGPRATLAAVIVLDQFSRNMYRGTADMFAWDGRAVALAAEVIDAQSDEILAAHERTFLYMPFMHSESLSAQRRGERLFARLANAHTGRAREALTDQIDFARRHREIVERFGRFPHRNDTLGRVSTGEERAFLQTPGSSF